MEASIAGGGSRGSFRRSLGKFGRSARFGAGVIGLLLIVGAGFLGHGMWRRYERPRRLKTILTNRTIWGPQFPAVLNLLPAWRALGEDEITLSGDRLVGDRQLASLEDARSLRLQLQGFLAKPRVSLQAVDELYRSWTKIGIDVPRLQSLIAGQQLELLPDNGKLRLATRVPRMEPLSQRLTASLLTKEIGDPDEVKRSVVRSDFEGRSRALTVYSYEDGSVRFVTSSYAPLLEGTAERIIETAVLKVSQVAPLVER
jgi:hypothetical protein